MKVIEQYIFEVGDLFNGAGVNGGYLVPNTSEMLVNQNSYVYVIEIGLNSVYLSGGGIRYDFTPEQLTDHLKRGNLVYIGNALKGNK